MAIQKESERVRDALPVSPRRAPLLRAEGALGPWFASFKDAGMLFTNARTAERRGDDFSEESRIDCPPL